jgi:hypothetical protein
MKHKFLKYSLLLMMTISSHCMSAEWVELSEFTLWGTMYYQDVIRISVDDEIVNPDNCTNPDSYLVSPDIPENGQQRSFSLLLAAQRSSNPVYVYVTGCSSNRPSISAVRLMPYQ